MRRTGIPPPWSAGIVSTHLLPSARLTQEIERDRGNASINTVKLACAGASISSSSLDPAVVKTISIGFLEEHRRDRQQLSSHVLDRALVSARKLKRAIVVPSISHQHQRMTLDAAGIGALRLEHALVLELGEGEIVIDLPVKQR